MGQEIQQMQQAKKRFWRVMAPLMIYLAVRYVAEIMVFTILYLTHLSELIDLKPMESMDILSAVNYVYSNMANIVRDNEIINKMNMIVLENIIWETITVAFCAISVGLTFFLIDKKTQKKTGIPRQTKEAAWKYPLVIILGMVTCLGLNILLNLCDQVFFKGATSQSSLLSYNSPLWLQIIGMGLIVPISEELFYRGVLYNRYRENGTFMRAAVYSSLLFMLAHGTMIQMIYALILGIMLCYVYEKFGSIFAPICLHMTVNIVSILATKVDAFTWILSKAIRAGVITIACAFIGSTMIVYFQNLGGRDYQPLMESSEDETKD